MKLKAAIRATCFALLVVLDAQAVILTPADAMLMGSSPQNLKLSNVIQLTGFTGSGLTPLYINQHPGISSGSFSSSYTTTYSNTASNPSNATINYVGGSFIGQNTTANYLYVKGGGGRTGPFWYLFNISPNSLTPWNGTSPISLQGFWPGPGSISTIRVYGTPEPLSVVTWSVLMPIGLVAWLWRRRASV